MRINENDPARARRPVRLIQNSGLDSRLRSDGMSIAVNVAGFPICCFFQSRSQFSADAIKPGGPLPEMGRAARDFEGAVDLRLEPASRFPLRDSGGLEV